MARIVIVGGGIAGLSAAYELTGHPSPSAVILLEAQTRLGGKVLTAKTDGFVLEGGPDSFLASKPAAVDLCHELGLDSEIQSVSTENRGASVLFGGQLHPIPEGFSGLVPARLDAFQATSLLTTSGKERLLAEPGVPARQGTDDETLAAFLERRFGKEAFEQLIEPLVGGIYAGDAAQLSLLATLPHLRRMELELGSLVKGTQNAITNVPTPSDSPRSGFLTFLSGMQRITDRLAEKLIGCRVETNTEVRSLEESGSGFRVVLPDDSFEADGVILATPAHASARIVEQLDPELARLLATIPYGSSANVYLAIPSSSSREPLRGTGYVVPSVLRRAVTACTFVSNKFRHRAPHGMVLLRMFFGRYGSGTALTRSDEELVEIARQEASEVLGIEGDPLLHRVFRWPRSMPQYNIGHNERLVGIAQRLECHPALALAGAAYEGVGIPDCVASGRRAASRIAEQSLE